MTVNSLQPAIAAQPKPDRLGQGTAVEQSRAVAEVEASVLVAMRYPRDIDWAIAEMRRSCARMSLAEKAFFRFSRGEGPISGPSVQLARELARCFGNFHSGLIELRRDDQYHQSEMQAWAWDLQTNFRTSTTFIVPHIRDTKKGPKDLIDVRDVYENNANMGARRQREMIFAVLPAWFGEDAQAACYQTLSGDVADLPQRRDKCVQLFAELGITTKQLARKVGSPVATWSPGDLATLTVIYRSLQRGEILQDDEFEPAGLSAADIVGVPVPQPAAAQPAAQLAAQEPAGQPDEQPPPPPEPDPASAPEPEEPAPASVQALDDAPGTVTRDQVNALWAIASTKLGFGREDKATFRQACETILGRKMTGGTTGNLSANEAIRLEAELAPLQDRSALLELLAKKAADRAAENEARSDQ